MGGPSSAYAILLPRHKRPMVRADRAVAVLSFLKSGRTRTLIARIRDRKDQRMVIGSERAVHSNALSNLPVVWETRKHIIQNQSGSMRRSRTVVSAVNDLRNRFDRRFAFAHMGI